MQTLIKLLIENVPSVAGIFTGKFENISQVQNAIKNGGILDNISDLLSVSIDFAKENNVINSNIYTMLKQGKNTIIKAISRYKNTTR